LLGAAILLAARSPGPTRAVAAAGGPNTEIVLDVSGSVGDSSSKFASKVLIRLAHSGGRVGLILFSDTAQETLPPGTPASQLLPFARAFTPPSRRGHAFVLQPPQHDSNPWHPSFSGGTRISSGLAAAGEALHRDRARGSVLLISDLGDPASDTRALKRQLAALDRGRITVKILPLPNALLSDLRWFTRLEGSAAFDKPLATGGRPDRPATSGVAFPAALAAAAGLLALVLAANELAARSLRWGVAR
jgi:hypothetical protein